MKRIFIPFLLFCLMAAVTSCSDTSSTQSSSALEAPEISGDVNTITEDTAEAEAEKLLKEIDGL